MRELVKDTTNRNFGKKMHTCRLCGAEGMFDSYLVREMMKNTGEEFEYFICGDCGCLQIAEIPSELGKYYGKDYYSFAQEEFPDIKYQEPVKNLDAILDVGCGSGMWLFQKALAGWGNLHGCDPFLEKDMHYGDRVHIKKCSIHEIAGKDVYDEIWMKDSFEHMADPIATMQSASRLLKPEGILAMHIPVFPNIAWDMFGAHWFQIDAPRHIFLYSKKGLEYLEKQSGLKIVRIEYDSGPEQIFVSFFYSMGISYEELTMEIFSQSFDEEAAQSMVNAANQCNQSGYGDHAKIYWMHRDVAEQMQHAGNIIEEKIQYLKFS